MIFLLDTDTCSAHTRRPARLAHRFIQYTGGLAIPTIVLAELYPGWCGWTLHGKIHGKTIEFDEDLGAEWSIVWRL
jgi:hypothetical protein